MLSSNAHVFRPKLQRLEDRTAPATLVWVGDVSGLWGASSGGNTNWFNQTTLTNDVLPHNGDDLQFTTMSANHTQTNNITNLVPGSISLSDTDYIIGGNAITVDTITDTSSVGANVLNLPITGPVTVAVNVASTRLTLGGVISGSGALTKSGNGILRLSGGSANTYTGLTTVSTGTLELNKSSNIVAVPGNLTINSGGIARELGHGQVVDTSTVTVGGGGTFDLNGFIDTIGPLTVNGGSATIGIGSLSAGAVTMTGGSITGLTSFGVLTLRGNVTINTAATTATISGSLDLNGSTRTFTVADGAGTIDLDISAEVFNGGLTKDGPGTLRLSGSVANDYTGLTTVSAGTLELNKSAGVIAVPGDLTISGGTAIELANNQIADTSTVSANSAGVFNLLGQSDTVGTLRVNGGSVTTGAATLGALAVTISGGSIDATGNGQLLLLGDLSVSFGSPTPTISGTINLGNAIRTFFVPSSSFGLNISAAVTSGGLTKTGDGQLHFFGSNSNTYTNPTTVSLGSLFLEKTGGAVAVAGNLTINGGTVHEHDNQIANGSTVTVASGGVFDLDLFDATDAFGALTVIGGSVTIGLGTLTAGPVTMTGGSISSSIGKLVLQGNVSTNVASATATISGNLDLGGTTRTFNVAEGTPAIDLDISAVVTGTGSAGLSKTGPGTLQLKGSVANTYTGTTTVSAGTLELAKTGGALAVAGDLTINGAIARELADSQIATTTVTVDTGLFDLNGFSDTIGPLIVSSGNVTIGAGVLTSGSVTMTDGSIASTGAGKLVLQGNVTTFVSSATATISGNLDLGGTTRTFNVADGAAAIDLEISAVISGIGSAGLTKSGAGTLRLSGSAANAYGPTTVLAGLLVLLKTGGAVAVPADLIMNGGIVRELFINQIADTSTVTVNEPGIFELNGLSDTIGFLTVSGISGATTVNIGPGTLTAGSVTMTGGSIFSTGAGKLVLQGGLTTHTSTVTATILGNLDLGGDFRIFNIADGAAGPDLDISAVIGNGAVQKQTGTGTLRYSGTQSNTYGATSLNSGTIELAKSGGAIAIATDIEVGDGLGGADADVLRLLADHQIADSSPVLVSRSGMLALNDFDDTFWELFLGNGDSSAATVNTGTGVLALGGDVTVFTTGSAGAVGATISGNLDLGGATRTFNVADGAAAIDLSVSAIISGTGSEGLTKAGAGALSLGGSASNTYAGTTTVSAGTLELAKSIGNLLAAPGNVNIIGGTVRELTSHQIADTGTVTITGGTFDLNGQGDTVGSVTVAVGTLTTVAGTAGRLTASNTSFNSTANLVMRLVDANASDRLTVNGTLAVGGALILNPTQALPIGTAITLIDNDGADPVTGAFANLPQGATFLAGSQLFSISYAGGTGNDVVVTRTGGPTVLSTRVNDGSAQRSRVTSLTLTFSGLIDFGGTNAFTLTRIGGGAVTFGFTAIGMNGVTIITLNNFTGSETEFGSLKDGRYTLTALASQINQNGFALDGNGDGTPGDNFTFGDAQGLFRFFGDVNGDQTVNGFDLGFFRNAFGTQIGDPNYLSFLDFNGDGVINGFDLGQFRLRFGTMLP